MRYFSVSMMILIALFLTGCPTKYELGFPGPNPVAVLYDTFDYHGHTVEFTVYYPDTDPPMQNLPVVIVNTGWNQPRAQYAGYGTQLAQWGYVAVIHHFPSVGLLNEERALFDQHVEQDMLLLDWCAAENLRADSPLYGMMDANNAGTVGHSLGGGVSLRAVVADPRFKAAVSLDVSYAGENFDDLEPLADVDAAVMYLASEQGGWCARPSFSNERLYDYTSAPAIEVTIMGADHIDFMDSLIGADRLANLFCPRGDAEPQDVRNIATRYMIAWFNVYLKGMSEYKSYYDGPFAQDDVENNLVSIRANCDEEEP